MGSLTALPALAVRPPQPNDALGSFERLMTLRSLMNQQQVQQQQIQAGEQENQMRTMQVQDALKMRELSPQFVTKDSSGKVTGYDWNGFQNAAMSAGVSPGTIAAAGKAQADYQLSLQNLSAKERENHEAVNKFAFESLENIRGEQDPAQRQLKYQQAIQKSGEMGFDTSKYPQQVPDDNGLSIIEAGLGMHAQALANAKTQAETTEATQKGQQAQAETQKLQTESAFYSKMGLAPGVSPDMAAYAAYLQKGGKPEGWAGYKAQQEAAATQPFKIQTAQVEAQTRMAMEGMAKPVYAWNPQTNQKDLMNQTEALAQGRKVMTPVTAKEVSEDTMLINRLSDVHQKIAEYQNALDKPISAKDQGNLAALLGTDKAKLGVHPHGVLGGISFDIPLDRLDAALNKENLSGLSANARDQLVAYRNAREAMTGYTRVLTGSGRSSDKNLELQEQTLPDPTITDRDFSQRALEAFKQNLRVVGQGLPNIPGIKTPQQWEDELRPRRQPGPVQSAPQSFIPNSFMSLLQQGR